MADTKIDYEKDRDDTIWKKGRAYAQRIADSKALTDERKLDREEMEKIDLTPAAFHAAVGLVRRLAPTKLEKYLADFNLVLRVLGTNGQQELFPEEAAKAAKREETAQARLEAEKQRVAEEATVAGRSPDHPRSDPKKGGAGTKGKRVATELPPIVEDLRATEQAEGAEALEGMIPETTAARKSQSAQVAEVREKLGMH